VHSVLKHTNVLEFLNAVIVEPNGKSHYYPGIYMLLELAAGGDLFDKIGAKLLHLRVASGSSYYLCFSSGRRCWGRNRTFLLLSAITGLGKGVNETLWIRVSP
jgi:hypothetical protein